MNFLPTRILRSPSVQLFLQTFLKWQQDECQEMGAALAYYALFSLFPVLLVILSLLGWVLGPKTDAYKQILTLAEGAMTPEAYQIVRNTLLNLNQSSLGAGLVGFGLLVLTASQIFAALDRSVDKIWQVPQQEQENSGIGQQVLKFLKNKLSALMLVVGSAIFLWLSLLSNIAIGIVLQIAANFQQTLGWLKVDELLLFKGLQLAISFGLLLLGVMGLFTWLPSTQVKWRDTWLGALLTVNLLLLLQRLVGSGIVSLGERFRAYGALGGVMVLLLWLYLTCQIFFLGCEFTYIYAHLFGSRRR